MSTSAPVPKDHPLMIAWTKHKITEEYANSKKWATYTEHLEGSLWGLFMAGFNAALASSAVSEPGQRVAEWQPIETAPKTSRAILVYCWTRKNIYTVCYGKVGAFIQTDGWRHFGGGGDLIEQPTHWMPLPPAPHAAAPDTSKKPDLIDTSGPHVDGVDTSGMTPFNASVLPYLLACEKMAMALEREVIDTLAADAREGGE